jgi:para-nitrobenzyl esterase
MAERRAVRTLGRFILLAAFGLAIVIDSGCSAQQGSEQARIVVSAPPARVAAGGETLLGEQLDAATGLTVFRGIPFAAPPTGERRWRPPAPHEPRQGVQDASQFGPACPQLQGNPEFYRFVAERFGASPDRVEPLRDISEDCLYLNVWTKHPGQGEKRPVMVWIYGGSNINGYSQEPEYLGHHIARRDVVYVSLNYRVGVLGFLAHAGLSAESPQGVSGNYGLLDQIAALQWVRDNIAAFGGDPDNVTVFGESAGAGDIAVLMASPLAQGLFHRAISQSGGYPVDSFYTLAEAEAMGARIATHLGVEETSDPAAVVAGLREIAWPALVQGAVDAEAGKYNAVTIDGWLLPDALASIYARGAVNPVELMIGANANEDYPWVKEDATAADLASALAQFGSPYQEELRKLLMGGPDAPVRMQLDRLGSAETFLCPSQFIAKAMAVSGKTVYFYRFSRVRPGGERLLAYHGAEISYALDTAYDWMPADEIDRSLTDTVGRYWVNFAATGSPNGVDLPHWPRFTAAAGEYQDLGDAVSPGSGLETELCAVLDRRRAAQMAEFD